MLKVALAGNPNSGKTTLFNALTGNHGHVGNWPGVTVEKKEGFIKHHKQTTLIDLPGIYSLSPYSLEEMIARDFLVNERPDIIVNVVDGSNLERNLFLTTQLLELNIPVIVALNMMDIVNARQDEIYSDQLAKDLGCEVVEIIAKNEKGLKNLIKTIHSIDLKTSNKKFFNQEINDTLYLIETTINHFQPTLRFESIKCFERDDKMLEHLNLSESKYNIINNAVTKIEQKYDDDSESIIITQRYATIKKIIERCSKKMPLSESLSDKIDKILTHKWFGLPIFFIIMGLIYYLAITSVGDVAIGWVETFVETIQSSMTSILVSLNASDWAIGLVVDGVIGGIGAILPFIPQLMILFLLLSFLEDSGYMARVAFLMDRVFRQFGLSGRSFIAMLIGTGCSIPGVMASRTIEDENDRKMTILLTPFVPCGAKIPVFAMFIGIFFQQDAWIAPFIYIFALAVIIISGIVLKKTKLFGGKPSPFIMELPDYKLPRFKSLLFHMWDKAKGFVTRAGTIIFLCVTIVWFLQSFTFNLTYLGPENIDQSILASLGNILRYLFIPLGFGDSWAPATAALTGMVAKEVAVSTFTTIGSITPIIFSKLSALSFIIFTILAAPCFAAIGAMKRELGSNKLLAFALTFQTGLAYIMSFLTYQIGKIFLVNTSWLKPINLVSDNLESLSENELFHHDISLYILLGFITLCVLLIFINWCVQHFNNHLKVAE